MIFHESQHERKAAIVGGNSELVLHLSKRVWKYIKKEKYPKTSNTAAEIYGCVHRGIHADTARHVAGAG